MSSIGGPGIVRDGLVFGYDADDRSSRFYPGEPTTNLFTDGGFENGNSSWYGVFGTVTLQSTDYVYEGNYACKIVGNSSTVSDDSGISFNIGAIDQGTYYANFMMYIVDEHPNNYTGYIRVIYSDATSNTYGWNYSNKVIGDWFNVYTSFTPNVTKTITGCYGYIYTRNSSGVPSTTTYYIDNIQLEQKPHATQFVNGTRSSTQGLLDLTGNNAIDLSNMSFDDTAHPVFDGTSDYIGIPYDVTIAPSNQVTYECVAYKDNWVDSINKLLISKTENGGYNMGMNIGALIPTGQIGLACYYGGTYRSAYTPQSSLSVGYHYFSGTCDGRYLKFYVDGINVSTYDLGYTALITYSSNNLLAIGAEAGPSTVATSGYFNGQIPIVHIYNRSLTQSEITQNFNAYKNRFSI